MTGFLRVSPDGHGFVDEATGAAFVPMGCNYFDPKTGWAPKIWAQYDHDRVARQLAQIVGAGLNAVRVFLDISALNPSAGVYSDEGFAKVDDMIAIAERAGIRIIFSGPNIWQGQPAHRRGDAYADTEQQEHLTSLWARIAQRWGDNPTVMAWDLLNEPRVRWPSRADEGYGPRWQRWKQYAEANIDESLPEEYPSTDPESVGAGVWRTYLRFQEGLAEEWVQLQTAALRESGARQMITVGLIQWSIPIMLPARMGYAGFNPRRIEPYLDYMSIHFYPMLRDRDAGLGAELAVQRAYLQAVARGAYIAGKPLVLEEFGWKGGKLVPGEDRVWPQEHQTLWGEALVESTRDVAAGWLNWGYADAADPHADISAATGLWTQDEELKDWGRRFSAYAAAFRADPPAYKPADRHFELDIVEYLIEHKGAPSLAWLEQRVAEAPHSSLGVTFH